MSGGVDPDEVYPDFHEVKKILVDAGMDPGEAWDKAGLLRRMDGRAGESVGGGARQGGVSMNRDRETLLRYCDALMGEYSPVSTSHVVAAALKATLAENAALRRQVAQGGDRVLRCAFCGEEYPPGTPASHHERLAAHIFRCEQHPLGKVARLADKLTDCLNEFSDNPGCCGEHVQAIDDALAAVRNPLGVEVG